VVTAHQTEYFYTVTHTATSPTELNAKWATLEQKEKRKPPHLPPHTEQMKQHFTKYCINV